MIVNGREYRLWGHFVERKADFVGGVLEDHDDDPLCVPGVAVTEITDIELVPNGETSAFFRVCGKDFDCGFDVEVGGVDGSFSDSKNGWIGFYGFGGHKWRIKKPNC